MPVEHDGTPESQAGIEVFTHSVPGDPPSLAQIQDEGSQLSPAVISHKLSSGEQVGNSAALQYLYSQKQSAVSQY